jgi:hypothetical protein
MPSVARGEEAETSFLEDSTHPSISVESLMSMGVACQKCQGQVQVDITANDKPQKARHDGGLACAMQEW